MDPILDPLLNPYHGYELSRRRSQNGSGQIWPKSGQKVAGWAAGLSGLLSEVGLGGVKGVE